jgi:hypothetical protein
LIRRILVLLTAAMVALSMTAGAALAHDYGNGKDKDKDKVCVKHKTGSKKNKYVFIKVPAKDVKNGKAKHGNHYDKIVNDKKCEKKNAGKKKAKKKVCVAHKTSSKTNPVRYIYIPKHAAVKHVKNHGDTILKGKTKAECKALNKSGNT